MTVERETMNRFLNAAGVARVEELARFSRAELVMMGFNGYRDIQAVREALETEGLALREKAIETPTEVWWDGETPFVCCGGMTRHEPTPEEANRLAEAFRSLKVAEESRAKAIKKANKTVSSAEDRVREIARGIVGNRVREQLKRRKSQ